MSDDLISRLQDAVNGEHDMTPHGADVLQAVDRIEELEAENAKLRKGLELYQRERDRFKHTHPEMSGSYFLSGGHGDVDDNLLPQFVQIVPAYGCAWVQVYEKTDKIISYEGS